MHDAEHNAVLCTASCTCWLPNSGLHEWNTPWRVGDAGLSVQSMNVLIDSFCVFAIVNQDFDWLENFTAFLRHHVKADEVIR